MAINTQARCTAMLLEKTITEWFAKNRHEERVKASEVMPFLIEKNIFDKGDNAVKLINLLKRLYEADVLDLVPHADYEHKGMGMVWYLQRLESDGAARKSEKMPQFSEDVSRYRAELFAGYKE